MARKYLKGSVSVKTGRYAADGINPCFERLCTYEPGDLVMLDPQRRDLRDFYKNVLGIDLPEVSIGARTAVHFIGMGCGNDSRANTYCARVLVPYGGIIIVSCCQIIKKLSPHELLAMQADANDQETMWQFQPDSIERARRRLVGVKHFVRRLMGISPPNAPKKRPPWMR